MSFIGVRRLAALDMWGLAGTRRRRQLIRAEFLVGVLGCTGLGALALTAANGWMTALGIWLVGAGVNYVPLAVEAQRLSKPGALEEELKGIDIPRELRRAGIQQLWIAVPFAVVAFSAARRKQGASRVRQR